VTTLVEKLRAAREACAVGPVEVRALLRATGKDAKDYLHRMSTQDLNRLAPGEAAYATFLSAKGHVLAEGRVLAQEDGLLLDLDPRTLPDARVHLERLVIMDDVVFEDLSRRCASCPCSTGGGAAARGHAPGLADRARSAGAPGRRVPPAARGRRAAPSSSRGGRPLDDGLEALGSSRRAALWRRRGRVAPADGGRAHARGSRSRRATSTGGRARATARGHLQRGLVQLPCPRARPRREACRRRPGGRGRDERG
jgi:hypothetical protein